MAKRVSNRATFRKLPLEIRRARLINWKSTSGKKIPVDSDGHNLEGLNSDPQTVGFDRAVSIVESGLADGIGLPITNSKLCAIDIDDCVVDGTVVPWAKSLVRQCDSYTEFSPSGRGLHILMRGTPKCPNARRLLCGSGHIDIFATNGYVTLTGRPLPGYAGKPLRSGGKAIKAIHDRLVPWSSAIKEILKHRVMRELWRGEWTEHYGSQSEADLALLGYIARHVQDDPTLIDELFRQSGLCRKKWRTRKDYRDRTIRKVLGTRKAEAADRDDNFLLDGIVRVSDEKAGNINWLWKHRIPRGSLSAFAGDPEAGKGTSYCSLVATVTTGGKWPGETERAPKGSVVIFTTEDDVATVIKPRIIAAGGDPNNVYVYRESFTFKNDLTAFKKLLEARKPIWVIFDPGKPYIGSLRNAHDDAEIRAILDPLALTVSEHQIACTFVYHLTKDDGRDLVHRLLGSIAHVAYPRAVWAIGENPRDRSQPRLRGFMPLKNNLYDRRKVGGYEFVIEGTDVTVDGELIRDVPRANWRANVVMMVAEDYFEKSKAKKRIAAQRDAEDILEQYGGELPSVDLYQKLREKGHSLRTSRRAMKGIDIVRFHGGKKQRGQHRVKLKSRKTPK